MHLSFIPLPLLSLSFSIFPSLIHTRLENTSDLSSLLIRVQVNHKDRGLSHKRVINSPADVHSSVPMEWKTDTNGRVRVQEWEQRPTLAPIIDEKEASSAQWHGQTGEKKGRETQTGNGKRYLQFPLGVDDRKHRWDYLHAAQAQAHYLHINDRWGDVIHGKSISFVVTLVQGCFESH